MGFTTGFLAGTALTLSTVYLTLQAHHRTRAAQSITLQHAAASLTAVTDPGSPTAEQARRRAQRELAAAYRLGAGPTPAELEAREGLVGMAKARWNREVVGAVRWAEGVDGGAVWDGVERVLGAGWRSVRQLAGRE